MSPFGFTEQEFAFLMENFVSPLKKLGARVYLFGSRATGKQQKFSDVDLLFSSSPQLPSAEVYVLLAKMEESSFPYKIDLVNEAELAHSYKDSVNRDKIEL